MDEKAFADRFAQAHQDIYLHAVRRVRDKREQLTRETAAFLLHLAEAGPMTLTELSRHLDRAPSTLSEMVDHQATKDLIRREPDPQDGRRKLLTLTDEGLRVLYEVMPAVLDVQRRLTQDLTDDERAELLALLHRMSAA